MLDSELISDNYNADKKCSELQLIIRKILIDNKITFERFKKMYAEAVKDMNFTTRQVIRNRTRLIMQIIGTGKRDMGFNNFKFILNNILKKDLPDGITFDDIKPINPRLNDLVGKRFDRLVVKLMIRSDSHHTKWYCECDCGDYVTVTGTHLMTGHTRSCGCYRRENTARMRTTHGMSYESIHNIWRCMKERCSNVNSSHYHDYGGRGIKVCDEWLNSFEQFYEDMGDRPEDKTLDRRDNDGNYEPGNCRWATIFEQARNKRSTVIIDGVSLAEFAENNGIPYKRVHGWKTTGLTGEQMLNRQKKLEVATIC